jgi:hypothetical protein
MDLEILPVYRPRRQTKLTPASLAQQSVAPVQMNDQKAFTERLAASALANDREFLDGLDEHEKMLAVQILRELAESPDMESLTLDKLWEIDYWEKPVSIEQFLTDPYYMGGEQTKELYPCWRKEMYKVFAPGARYTEWVMGGSLGCGKTTAAMLANQFVIYRNACLRDPHKYYGLMKGNEIVYIIFSLTGAQANEVGYGKLKSNIDSCPWFNDRYPRVKRIEARVQFKKHKAAITYGSQVHHSVGRDIFSFCQDEANFYALGAANAADAQKRAQTIYSESRNRITSRFGRAGGLVAGMSFLMSSKRSVSSFMEQHVKDSSRDIAEGRTIVTEFAHWEAVPHKYTQPTFPVEVGDRVYPSRILRPGEPPRDGAQVINVPGDVRARFEQDIDQALRDLAGVATFGVSPLFRDRTLFSKAVVPQLAHPFTRDEFVVTTTDDLQIHTFFKPQALFKIENSVYTLRLNPQAPRFFHVDIGLKHDSAGISICHVAGVTNQERKRPDGTTFRDMLPIIIPDITLRLVPSSGQEISLEKIRTFFYHLRAMGMPILMGSFDGFASQDSVQLMTAAGWEVKVLSVDRNDEPYMMLKQSFIEGRIQMYNYPPVIRELGELEYDLDKKKVDHPQGKAEDGRAFCLVGNTRVALLNGTNPTIRKLARIGKPVSVYTIRDGQVSVARGVHPRLTMRDAETVIVTMDNGRSITCTPNHRFMLRDGTYCEAAKLTAGASLMPLYRKVSKKNTHEMAGYELFWDPSDESWHFTHRMVARTISPAYAAKPKGWNVHHTKGKANNSPEALSVITKAEHARIHTRDLLKRRADPLFEKRRMDAAVAYAQSAEGRAVSRRNMTLLHRSPKFAKLMKQVRSQIGRSTGAANITKYNKSVAHRVKAAEIGRKTVWAAIEAQRGMPHTWSTGPRAYQWRHDVTIDVLTRMAQEGMSAKEARASLRCGACVIRRALAGTPWKALRNNHKVVSVVPGPRSDVYDLSVPGTQNFALSAGVFVHNSKDTSDALCGAVYHCLTDIRARQSMSKLKVDWKPSTLFNEKRQVHLTKTSVPWSSMDKDRHSAQRARK